MTRNPVAAAMSEDRGPGSLESHIRKLMKDLGLWGFHPHSSRYSAKGFPDWLIVGPHKIIFRELKSEYGRVTPEQRQVGEMLRRAGQSWGIWRPSDLLSGQIGRELTDLASLQQHLFDYGEPA